LAQWKTQDVFDALKRAAKDHPSAGIVEALGSFARVECMPLLDRALEDDMMREAAERGFRSLGPRARPALILSATTPLPLNAEERPSSLRRRVSALKLLVEIGLCSRHWVEIRQLLSEPSAEIVCATADLAFKAGPREDQVAAGLAVLRVLPDAPWDLRMNAPDQLARCFPELAGSVDAELRARLTSRAAAVDPIVGVLQRTKRIAMESAH
jgi:hypothetical protein